MNRVEKTVKARLMSHVNAILEFVPVGCRVTLCVRNPNVEGQRAVISTDDSIADVIRVLESEL